MTTLSTTDPQVSSLIKAENTRQQGVLNMIPSENCTSTAVREAVGSVLMHKYSEGNIGTRYYEGNENIDQIEQIAIKRAKELFKLPPDWEVNVQALSGSNANLAVYLAVLKPGETLMGMHLPDGGHLSHGWSYEPGGQPAANTMEYLGGSRKVNISAQLFCSVQYRVDPQTQLLDYDKVEEIALKHRPKLLITGGTAYPRDIDYRRMAEIAHKVGALYMADVAHEAGLIAAGVLPSPVGIADIVTMTTHKTLRAARGAIILAHQDVIKKVNRAVLPGLQGGPFNNNIAGIAVGLLEALQPDFRKYAEQVVKNAQSLATELTARGFDLVSGGTDKHLILVDLTNKGVTGKPAAKALAQAGIVLNMNTMPGETRPPSDPSAIRLGTPFITTQGFTENEMPEIAKIIDQVIDESKRIINGMNEFDLDKFLMLVKKSQVMKAARVEVEKMMARVLEL